MHIFIQEPDDYPRNSEHVADCSANKETVFFLVKIFVFNVSFNR